MIYSVTKGCDFWDAEALVLENDDLRDLLKCCLAEKGVVLAGGGGTGVETPALSKARKLLDVRPDVIMLNINGNELPVLWKALDDGLFATDRPVLMFTTNPRGHKRYEPEAFQKLCKALTIEGYEVNRLENVFVCLPEEPDHEQRPAIHKLLHGGLQGASPKTPSKAEVSRTPE